MKNGKWTFQEPRMSPSRHMPLWINCFPAKSALKHLRADFMITNQRWLNVWQLVILFRSLEPTSNRLLVENLSEKMPTAWQQSTIKFINSARWTLLISSFSSKLISSLLVDKEDQVFEMIFKFCHFCIYNLFFL